MASNSLERYGAVVALGNVNVGATLSINTALIIQLPGIEDLDIDEPLHVSVLARISADVR